MPWIDRGEERGIEDHILTFTKERWIQYRTRRDLHGNDVVAWARSGAWSIANGVVTRTWIDRDDGSRRAVDKDFRIEGDMLHVDRWTAHVPVDDTWAYVSRVDTDPESSWRRVVGNTLTFAIAPTAEEATSVIVSGFWNEQTYGSDTGEWELGNADFPYGQYDFLMMRVDQ